MVRSTRFTRVPPPAKSPRTASRLLRAPVWAAPLAAVLVASAAVAGVTITYNTSSSASLSIKEAPVQWSAGPDSSGNQFVSSWSLSANKTFFSLTLKPVPEANVTWGNLTTLSNVDSAAYTVTVTGTSLASNAKVLDARLEFRNHGTDAVVATLNLRDASPSASLGSVAAGAKMYVKAYLKLDTATGSGDLPGSLSVSLTVA